MEKSSRILPDECGAVKVAEPEPSDVEFKVIRGTQTYRGQHPWQVRNQYIKFVISIQINTAIIF